MLNVNIVNSMLYSSLLAVSGAIGARGVYLQKTICRYKLELYEFKCLHGMLQEDLLGSPATCPNKYNNMIKRTYLTFKSVGDSEICMNNDQIAEYYARWRRYEESIKVDVVQGGCSASHHWRSFVEETAWITCVTIIPMLEELIEKAKNECEYLASMMAVITFMRHGAIGLL